MTVASSTVNDLIEEYDFQIDDIRWYLCSEMTKRVLAYREHPEGLTRLFWLGSIEKDLYDMEERFLRSLQEDLDRGMTDEANVRQIFQEVRRLKKGRRRN